MSLMVKVAERVIETVSNSNDPMLISGNPNLISPAPVTYEAFTVAALFFVFAAVVGVSVILWRSIQVRRFTH